MVLLDWISRILNRTVLAFLFLLFSLSLLTPACAQPESAAPAPSPSASHPAGPKATLRPEPSTTPSPPPKYFLDPSLPVDLKNLITIPTNYQATDQRQEADLAISTVSGEPIGRWYYALVAPFPSLLESISLEELVMFWRSPADVASLQPPLYLSQETKEALSLLWGDPVPDAVHVSSSDREILDLLWPDPTASAIIPLDRLSPRWKVISIDGVSPLESDDLGEYSLYLPIRLSGSAHFLEEELPALTNFNPEQLTTVAVTGVTALVRDTASIMEEKGITYPAEDVGALLREADITHISNEVPFASDCPDPDPTQTSLYFCSRDEYIQLLEAVGTDVVELSGDHFGDWGPEAMFHTLEMYQQKGWLTYGGGKSLQEGLQPVFIAHNGNQIAFIGCNGKGLERYATASESNPGAAGCDFDWMEEEIRRLSDQGFLVIATMQHEEIDNFTPVAWQIRDFHRLADAGAVIVSGSQAHHPQTMEFYQSAFIHYGLGNLFFDQHYLANYFPEMHINKDKGFIDMHSFYNGAHINTRVVPIQFLDNARPRLMTPLESRIFLEEVFRAADW